MTGGGAPGAPGIIRCLKKDSDIDLTVCDAQAYPSGKFLNDKFINVPLASDSNFIDFIFSYCVKEKIDVIFPLVTRELFLLSKNKNTFLDKGIRIIVSKYDSLNIANNKGKLYKHLYDNSILTPSFKVVSNVRDLKNSFISLGYPYNPICIKPCISNGSRGVRIIDENIDEYDLLFNHKPNSLYMTYKDLLRILDGKNFPELLVSEVLTGDEYTIDTLVIGDKPAIILPRKREKMNAGISVAGSFEKNEEIIKYCKKIILSLDLEGPIGIQVKKANDGKYKILEINPRIQGTSVAALGTGVNLPLLSVKDIMNVDIDIPIINWSISFIRYYDEVFYSK